MKAIKLTLIISITTSLVFLSLLGCVKENSIPTPQSENTVTDIDGNIYKTVTIGNQVWMAENLKTTKYNSGKKINFPDTNKTIWNQDTAGAYAWYNNETNFKNVYGALYNWYAVVNTEKLCPAGWKVPSTTDFFELERFLGGRTKAAGKLKQEGLTNWESPNEGATNMTGFTALPGGIRVSDGNYYQLGQYGHWWTIVNSQDSFSKAFALTLRYDYDYFDYSVIQKEFGLSVRCIKN